MHRLSRLTSRSNRLPPRREDANLPRALQIVRFRVPPRFLQIRGPCRSPHRPGAPRSFWQLCFAATSINSFEFDCLPRAIHADIVKAESTSSARAAASHASASRPRGVSTVIGSGQTGSAIIATRRQWLSRLCGRLIQMTVCSSGECHDLCPLPSTSSNKTKLPAGTRLSSPSLVWYSADPSSLTVSTRSGTVCQSTYRAPDGMRVKRTFDAAYFADTSNAAASG